MRIENGQKWWKKNNNNNNGKRRISIRKRSNWAEKYQIYFRLVCVTRLHSHRWLVSLNWARIPYEFRVPHIGFDLCTESWFNDDDDAGNNHRNSLRWHTACSMRVIAFSRTRRAFELPFGASYTNWNISVCRLGHSHIRTKRTEWSILTEVDEIAAMNERLSTNANIHKNESLWFSVMILLFLLFLDSVSLDKFQRNTAFLKVKLNKAKW